MWILCQSERLLLKVEYFRVIYVTDGCVVQGYSEEYGLVGLGEYDTMERSLEIMREVFDSLEIGKYTMPKER